MKYTAIYTDRVAPGCDVPCLKRITLEDGETIEARLIKENLDGGRIVFLLEGHPKVIENSGFMET